MPFKGFTLLETLLYLALTVIFLGGVLGGAYNLILSGEQNQAKVLVGEEGNFLLSKFLWALEGAKNVSLSSDGMTVNKLTSVQVFSGKGDSLSLKQADGSWIKLNADGVLIKNINFNMLNSSGLVNAQGVTINFALQTAAASGKVVSQNFSLTEYLKQ